jgi:hypothetical protein
MVWDTAYTTPVRFDTLESDDGDDTISHLDLDELPDIPARGLPPVSNTFDPMPVVITSRFYALHNLRTSARSWREVATIVRNMEPTLRPLVISVPAQQSLQERIAALDDIMAQYPDVEIRVEVV